MLLCWMSLKILEIDSWFSFVALIALLGVLDLYFINHAYHSTLTKGASVQLVFGFEVKNMIILYNLPYLLYIWLMKWF